MNPIGTCAMCLAPNVLLIRSHIVSRWVYRRTTKFDPTGGNALVGVGDGTAALSTKQAVEYLLCRPCEDRLSASEAYVAGQGLQEDGKSFPLLDTSPQVPVQGLDLRDMTKFDVARIMHFAISIIWRADVSQIEPIVSLGNVRDEVRQYLLGGPLPQGCYLIMALLSPPPGLPRINRIIGMPFSLPDGSGHKFIASGLNFTFLTNQGPDAKWTDLSLSHKAVATVSDGKLLLQAVAEETQTSATKGGLVGKT